VEQNPLVAVTQLEELAHLRCIEPLQVAEHDHRPLCRRKVVDRRQYELSGLTRKEARLR